MIAPHRLHLYRRSSNDQTEGAQGRAVVGDVVVIRGHDDFDAGGDEVAHARAIGGARVVAGLGVHVQISADVSIDGGHTGQREGSEGELFSTRRERDVTGLRCELEAAGRGDGVAPGGCQGADRGLVPGIAGWRRLNSGWVWWRVAKIPGQALEAR